MSGYQDLNWPGPTAVDYAPTYSCHDCPKNKYIFLKSTATQGSIQGTKILVNPRFKDNTKVFINPNFAVNKPVLNSRPNIHVNPNIINTASFSNRLPLPLATISSTSVSSNTISTDNETKILVSTKNKLIKVHQNDTSSYSNGILGTNKFNVVQSDNIKQSDHKIVSTRMKIVNVPVQNQNKSSPLIRRQSIVSRFKYVKSNKIPKKVNKAVLISKHKIINNSYSNIKNKILQKLQNTSQNSRKKYVYVNKFNSSSFFANNVILKNARKRSLINISGILYQNTPNVIKRTNLSKKRCNSHNTSSSQIWKNTSRTSLNKVIPVKLKRHSSLVRTDRSYQGRYNIVRSRLVSSSKLKKSNVSCSVFKRFGKCNGEKNGTCIKVHNPNQIVLCPKFLQGACIKRKCLLSHKVSAEKMPTCKYYLEGLCSRDDCQYLHVKISPKADICKDFLEGFCRGGVKCDKRHQFLCPDYEKNKKCPRKRCIYPHRNSRLSLSKRGKATRKIIKKKEGPVNEEQMEEEKSDKPKVRYYDEEVGNKDEVDGQVVFRRPKLGSLPSFIPLTQGTAVETDG